MRRIDSHDFDAIILGSGLSGSIVASILARHGHSVLIIDRGVQVLSAHLVIGESNNTLDSAIERNFLSETSG